MNYSRPKTLGEAARALAVSGAIGLAGGTDLLVHLGRDEAWPPGLVDLKEIPELHGIRSQDGIIRIGAATPLSQILESPAIEDFPALGQALRSFAGRAIRNRATLGGNLANASPAADTLPPLMIHEAVCLTQHRRIAVADLAVAPGETMLRPGEIIVSVEIPLPPKDAQSFFVKLAPREAMAIAVVNLAGLIVQSDGEVVLARIALGSVAPTVIRAKEAEEILEGHTLTKDAISQASLAAAEAASPIDDIRATADYRRRMIARLLNWELGRYIPNT
ncbi:xanthine dehydrogenase family protein subunit M [bacterium]|nr:xanthine dehydrogenase family protein subunit M [bacterium]